MSEVTHSSFYWPLKLLPASKRQAMLAVYDMCRRLDDIADGNMTASEKLASLEQWNQCFDQPETLPVALRQAMQRYDLPAALFQELIEGMQMDARGQMVFASEEILERYCYCAASTVGLLSIRIFGCAHPASVDFADALGQLLQRINIVRDIAEDAARGRCYLPREWVSGPLPALEAVATAPALVAQAIAKMDKDIDARFQALAYPRQDRGPLLPALAMAGIYHALWQQMRRDHYRYAQPYRLNRGQKMWGMLRGCFGGLINVRSTDAPVR